MSDALEAVANYGVAVVALIALAFFVYKIIIRLMDENKDRELRQREDNEKLMEANRENSEALSKVADTIDQSNHLYQSLSDTNRMLVDKLDGKINTIERNVEIIKTAVTRGE